MAKDLFRIVWEDLARAERAAARRRHVALSKAQAKAVKARQRNKTRARKRKQMAGREVRRIMRPRVERGGHWVMLERMTPGRLYTVTELAALMPEWPGGYRCVQPWLYQRLEPRGLVEKVRLREYTDAGHRARVHLFAWRLTSEGAARGGAAPLAG